MFRSPARIDSRHLGGFASACVPIVVSAIALSPSARADAVSVINAIRIEGCSRRAAGGMPLAPNATLDDVAHELARERELKDALERSGYRATSATSFHLQGSREDAAIRGLLIARACDAIDDRRYDEIGVFAAGDETWVVLAAPGPGPPHLEPGAVAGRVLTLINAARAEPRSCGRDPFAAAPPLTLSAALNEAASAHVRDMAARGLLDHRGSDGSYAGERITRAGYTWRASGENIAVGQRDEEAVVAAWLASPGHCATLMAPYFTETGVAFALASSRDPTIYWAQVFAAP